MQTQYIDRYEAELIVAKQNARSIPLDIRVESLEFVGAEETTQGKFYYYKEKEGRKYYYDSDKARSFRKQFPPRRKLAKR